MICVAILKDISRSMITSNIQELILYLLNSGHAKVKLEYARQSFSFAAAKIYNDLPIGIRNEKNFKSFKSLLHIHFV